MPGNTESGFVLTITDIDRVATNIATMWDTYNTDRRVALEVGKEAREYVFATDINGTSAKILPHKNRTHQPKLTQISDNLQSQYWEASLSMPQFFRYEGTTDTDQRKAFRIEAWMRTKIEARKFRQTTGRQLLADYVHYGNCFAGLDWIEERDDQGNLVYKGPDIFRVSPLDTVFNPRDVSFRASPKLTRTLMHIGEVRNLPEKYPYSGFKEDAIEKAVAMRTNGAVTNDWTEVIKECGLQMDGFSSYNDYFKQDLVEVLIYRGNIFNPDTGEPQTNRVIYVVDRMFVLRNEPSTSPRGFDGLHHAGWRIRNDNLWAQGPLDNLVGMQYRVDHLENLKADVFDLIAHPTILVKGENVIEPSEGYGPGATYYAGVDEDVKVLVPDAGALRADTEISIYHRMMEDFAGSPPETRGIRTPGEKTAFEVNKLDANATKMFVDKARNFELMLETILEEAFALMVKNFDGGDFLETFNDVGGDRELKEIMDVTEVRANGRFLAVGAQHWSRRNRETVEMQNFQMGPMQDPKIRAHVNGYRLAEFYINRLGLEDEALVEEYAGVKEDVRLQIIAEAEAQRLREGAGTQAPDEGEGATSAQGPAPLQPNIGPTDQNPVSTPRG